VSERAEVKVRIGVTVRLDNKTRTPVYSSGVGVVGPEFGVSGKDLAEVIRKTKAKVLRYLADQCVLGNLTEGGPETVKFVLDVPKG
jgi:hypothetical protein